MNIYLIIKIYEEVILLKTRADVLINGEYKRITIWDALDLKENRNELWEKEYRDNIFSINKNPENKVKMIFQKGRYGNLNRSYFKYENANFDHKGEGSEESYRHEFFKECISRIERLEIRWKGNALSIFPDEILQEETVIMDDGSRRIVDLLVLFKNAEPSFYVEKWEGKLAIEIYDSHQVDSKKISQMKQKGLACFEFTVNNWNIREYFKNAEEEEKQIADILKKLDGKNGGRIIGSLLVDPISKKYFSTKLFEEERKEKERVIADLNYIKKSYQQAIEENKKLMRQIQLLEENNKKYKNELVNLEKNLQNIEQENAKIKSNFWYRIFFRKK